MSYKSEYIAQVIGTIIGAIILIFILPIFSFWLNYFCGWITSLVIGEKICYALNLLFKSNYFTSDKLPWIAGALGWIGSFFRTTSSNKKNN